MLSLPRFIPLFLQEEPVPGNDYRSRVFLAYTLVFLCILAWLVLSHLRNSKVREDLDHLERRLRDLEERKQRS